LTSVKPFPSAHESILTFLDPVLSRAIVTYSHTLPHDTNHIKVHARSFEMTLLDDFKQAVFGLINNLKGSEPRFGQRQLTSLVRALLALS
jgi:hypothetical protein